MKPIFYKLYLLRISSEHWMNYFYASNNSIWNDIAGSTKILTKIYAFQKQIVNIFTCISSLSFIYANIHYHGLERTYNFHSGSSYTILSDFIDKLDNETIHLDSRGGGSTSSCARFH